MKYSKSALFIVFCIFVSGITAMLVGLTDWQIHSQAGVKDGMIIISEGAAALGWGFISFSGATTSVFVAYLIAADLFGEGITDDKA